MSMKDSIRLIAGALLGDAWVMSRVAHKNVQSISSASDSIPRIFVIGCPNYGNLGDHAIAYAERLFLARAAGARPVMLYGPVKSYWESLKNTVRPEDLICIQGGGNMGTLYTGFENERLAVLDQFKSNRIIVFPQTFSYGESDFDRRYLGHMQRVYSSHRDLHLVARERMSFNRMRTCFPTANVVLTPDIVLSLPSYEEHGRARDGLYLCLRDDKERITAGSAVELFISSANGKFGKTIKTDTILAQDDISPEEGESYVRAKIAELSQARLVITDRIHGMIFCALSGTPCIALDNSNGKVGCEYEWLKILPYMYFARDVEEAATIIRDGDLEPGRFPTEEFTPLFAPIAKLLPGRLDGQV